MSPAVYWTELSTWKFGGNTVDVRSVVVAVVVDVQSILAGCPNCRANREEEDAGYRAPSQQIRQFHHMHGLENRPIATNMSTLHQIYAQFAAGAIGGGTATYTTHWLDTIKVKMQTFPTDYRTGASCLRHTLREEGVRGLYHGVAPAVLCQATKAAIVFCSYGVCEEAVRSLAGKASTEDLVVAEHAAAGAMTGVLASFFLCPMELIKCRLQAKHQLAAVNRGVTLKPPMALARAVIRSEGVRGLYRGLSGIWVKEIPGSFIYFGSYETAKSIASVLNPDHKHSNSELFACGVYAGLCYCITHPVESVKTRVQVMSAVTKYRGFMSAFSHILKNEGIRPLWKGLRPSMLRACIYSGIQFLMYEKTKAFILELDKADIET